METANRRAIRPAAKPFEEKRPPSSGAPVKKQTPPEQTNAENFYYLKQMQTKTPMVVVMEDGETITGIIEWYDKICLKVNREDGPNLLIYKNHIKYMYKVE